jgi:hypothetical protein
LQDYFRFTKLYKRISESKNTLEDNLAVYKVEDIEMKLSCAGICTKIRKLSGVQSSLHFQSESEEQVICLELLTQELL